MERICFSVVHKKMSNMLLQCEADLEARKEIMCLCRLLPLRLSHSGTAFVLGTEGRWPPMPWWGPEARELFSDEECLERFRSKHR